MILRALVVWLAIVPLAILNGDIRVRWIIPRTGEAVGHRISCVTLSLIVLAVAWLAHPWVAPTTVRDAWRVGALWVACTVGFEFLAGHYVARQPWSALWADYDLRRGRLWLLVLATTAVAPALAALIRG